MRRRQPTFNSRKPPDLAAAIIRWLAEPDDRLSLSGDFTEEYTDLCHSRSSLFAGMWCWGQVFISLFSRIRSGLYWSFIMFINHLKIALRNLKRHKGFSFINITGLAVGMACCMLILLWVQDELSYDRFHENQKELYRIVQKVQGEWWTGSPWALAPIIKDEYPEVVKATRIAIRQVLATFGDKSDYQNACFVDQDFFDMFTFPFISGRAETAFPSPQSAVLTISAAEALFGPEDPIGQAVTVNNQAKFTVTGVIKDIPSNSSYDFDILAPIELFGEETLTSWAIGSSSFIQLQKNAPLKEFREKIPGIVMKYDRRTNQEILADIQPLNRIHLYDLRGGGLITYIYIFSTIAVFILLIACINFMNLSTARAGTRAREVGMRKVVGASRAHVIRQFYGESLLHSLGALVGAIGLVLLFLPAFNNLAQKSLHLDFATNFPLLLGLMGITLFTGLVSGSYPALFLSAFHPVKVLKGGHSLGPRNPLLRKVLVVTQFTIAVALLIGTVVMFKQLNFIRTKDMGYNRENLFSLPMNQAASRNYAALKQEFLQNPQVVNITAATSRPTQVGNINPVYWEGGGPDQYKTWNFVACDHDYIKTFGMELIAGRDFSVEFATDTQNYIVNEEAVKVMEMKDPIGKLFSIWENEGKIIGVVKNFHSRPLHNEMVPVALTLNQASWGPNYLFVRVRPESIQQTMAFLEEKWQQLVPNYPFAYTFLDEAFEALYRTDQRTGEIFKYFTVLAIIISCLGIFGLAAYTVEQRTKEIGVRKVLGATSPNIITLISKEFLVLLTIANCIAWPVAYLIMRKLLNNYAYRTGISAWIFPLAGVLAYGIALLTVSYQAFKAVRTDPVQALRYE